MDHQLMPGRSYPAGTHTWHYTNLDPKTAGRIIVLRHGHRTHAVARIDTLSDPDAVRDAELICAALDAADA